MEDVMGELENIFNEVKDADNVFENIPDGEYLGEIQGAEYRESKAGRPMVMISTKVIHGKYEGKYHNKFIMISGNDQEATRRNLNRMARELQALGVNTDGGFQATLDNLDKLVGVEVTMKIETTDGWTNTHLNLA